MAGVPAVVVLGDPADGEDVLAPLLGQLHVGDAVPPQPAPVLGPRHRRRRVGGHLWRNEF